MRFAIFMKFIVSVCPSAGIILYGGDMRTGSMASWVGTQFRTRISENQRHLPPPTVVPNVLIWPIRQKNGLAPAERYHTMSTTVDSEQAWWRHQIEIFSAWPAICAGNSPHKGQWRGALMFSLICVWIDDWVNNRGAGDLRRYRTHYDVTLMLHWTACTWHWRIDIILYGGDMTRHWQQAKFRLSANCFASQSPVPNAGLRISKTYTAAHCCVQHPCYLPSCFFFQKHFSSQKFRARIP